MGSNPVGGIIFSSTKKFIYNQYKKEDMQLKKEQIPIAIVHTIALVIFAFLFVSRKNYEFLWYIAVIIFIMFLIILTNDKIQYPVGLLWGLAAWSVLHMSGGGIFIGGTRLYDLIILRIVGEPYNILKYDQLTHAFGFAMATLLMYTLLNPSLKTKRWVSLSIIIILAGLGTGALNEIIEFFVTIITSNSGVGGYENTALDLVSNLIGAVIAMAFIIKKEKSIPNSI